MEETKERPTLVIECPDGTLIKIYQKVSKDYMKELIDVFMRGDAGNHLIQKG